VVFTRGGLAKDLSLVRTAKEVPTIVITDPASRATAEKTFADTGVRLITAEGRLQALTALRKAVITSLLVEGGGNLITALLADDLVDRIYWIQAPIFLGSGTRAFGERTPTLLGDAQAWIATDRQAMGKDTLLVLEKELCLPAS
jgi:riboflavin biosynthesis pyrimidine reductase